MSVGEPALGGGLGQVCVQGSSGLCRVHLVLPPPDGACLDQGAGWGDILLPPHLFPVAPSTPFLTNRRAFICKWGLGSECWRSASVESSLPRE